MDDIFSLDSLRLIKQQSAPGTPKSIHQHLCELSDFCTGWLALCEKYPKISASHQCILLLAALMMSGYVLGCCPILISMEEKHPRQTQDPQSTHIGKQIFGSRSVEFWQFFVKIFSWKNYREQNLCLTGWLGCAISQVVCSLFTYPAWSYAHILIYYNQHCLKN